MPICKAAKAFRERKNFDGIIEDSLDFKTWYHSDDVSLILGAYYQQLDSSTQASVMFPFVVPGFNNPNELELGLRAVINELDTEESQQKRYFPFIFAPEFGIHYMAGIIRKDGDSFSLILFNPVGNANLARLEFGELKDEINIISSPHPIQSSEKDNGPLSSCGPISIEFLRFAMNHLSDIDKLDSTFQLPESFLGPLMGQHYRETIKGFRQQHESMLQKMTDDQLYAIEGEQARRTVEYIDSCRAISQNNFESAERYEDDYFAANPSNGLGCSDLILASVFEKPHHTINSAPQKIEPVSAPILEYIENKPSVIKSPMPSLNKAVSDQSDSAMNARLDTLESKIKIILVSALSSEEKNSAIGKIKDGLLNVINAYRGDNDLNKFIIDFNSVLHTNDRLLRVHLNPIKRALQAFLDLFRKDQDKRITAYSLFSTKSANKIAEIETSVREINLAR